VTGLTWLRELSDGFQYAIIADGTTRCPHCPDARGVVEEWFDPSDPRRTFQQWTCSMRNWLRVCGNGKFPVCVAMAEAKSQRQSRVSKEVPCPRKSLCGLLDECEETGRIVIFAGFTGSIDRIVSSVFARNGTSCDAIRVVFMFWPQRLTRVTGRM